MSSLKTCVIHCKLLVTFVRRGTYNVEETRI